MSLQSRFIAFHDKIRLDSSTKEELREKRDVLVGILRDSGELPGFQEFSQGSYGMHLGVEPVDGDEYDIDVGLRFNVNCGDHQPLDLKNTIFHILENHTDYGAQIKRPCVTVTYKKGGEKAFHVDLVTYVYEDKDDHDSQMYLAKGKPGNDEDEIQWEKSDPIELVNHIKNTIEDEDDREQFRRIVKYLKRWKSLKFISNGHSAPPSIGITLLVLDDFISERGDDLGALIRAVDSIVGRFNYHSMDDNGRLLYTISCPMPLGLRFEQNSDAFEKMTVIQMTNFKDKVEKLLADLKEVRDEADLVKQCKKLNRIFGDDFDIPDAETVSKMQKNYIPLSTASGHEDGLKNC